MTPFIYRAIVLWLWIIIFFSAAFNVLLPRFDLAATVDFIQVFSLSYLIILHAVWAFDWICQETGVR